MSLEPSERFTNYDRAELGQWNAGQSPAEIANWSPDGGNYCSLTSQDHILFCEFGDTQILALDEVSLCKL